MQPEKLGVIADMEDFVEGQLSNLKSVEDSWQPNDFLPDMTSENWPEAHSRVSHRLRCYSRRGPRRSRG